MEDDEDERYPHSSYRSTQQRYRQKLPVRNASFSRVSDVHYEEDENSDDENGIEVSDDHEEPDDEEEDEYLEFRYDDEEIKRHPKKRKLKSLISAYEFAPRVPSVSTKFASVGRNPLTDWSEHETFVLLEAWGHKFIEHGRKSLRSDEWARVAEKVSKMSTVERTDTQCRNRLDTLKKKYKKEKAKVGETTKTSNWVFFGKMDELMTDSPPRVRRGNSESCDDSEGLPPKKRKSGRDNGEGSSFRMLADSICRFSEIYEKTESSKREQAMALEKMRMDLQRDLEAQRRKIMEKMRAEISRILQSEEGPAGKSS